MRKTSKLVVMMVILVTLFAVFAFSASAVKTVEINSSNAATAFTPVIKDGTSITEDTVFVISGTVNLPAGVIKPASQNLNITIKGDPSDGEDRLVLTSGSNLFELQRSQKLTIQDITLDGNGVNRLFYINSGSQLIIGEGALLTNGYRASGNGGAIFNGGTVIMNGGAISGCSSAGYGAAIYSSGTLIINGGIISGNTATAEKGMGGGVYVYRGSSATFNGGTITENKARYGGGIWFDGVTASPYAVTFTPDMIVTGNTRLDGTTVSNCGENNPNCADITMVCDWKTAADIAEDSGSFGGYTVGGHTDKILVKVHNDIEITEKVAFNGTIPIIVEGVDQGSNGNAVYPVIKRVGASSFIEAFFTIDAGSTVTFQKFTVDVNGYEKDAQDDIAVLKDGLGILMTAGSATNYATCTLGEGFVLKNAYNSKGNGAGIYCGGYSKLNISGGSIQSCICALSDTICGGGAIYMPDYTSLNMTAGTISGNMVLISEAATVTEAYGGGIYNYGSGSSIAISGGTFENNSIVTAKGERFGYGGAIAIRAGSPTLTISGATFSGNSAANGGAIFINNNATISAGTVIQNNSATNGGAIFVANTNKTAGRKLILNGGTVSGNTATYGAGIYIDRATVEMGAATISGNTSTKHGSGIYVIGEFDDASTTKDEEAPATLTIDGATIQNNSARGYYGGGLYINKNSTVAINNATLTGNSGSIGGAIRVQSSGPVVTISNTTISGNTVRDYDSDSGDGYGGGISNMGILTITDSIITDNTATAAAGIINRGSLTIDGSTIVMGNTASGKNSAFASETESNIGTDTAVTIKSTWTGSTGITPYITPGIKDGISFTVATVENGASGTISGDSLYTATVAGGKAVVTAKNVGEIHKIYNGGDADIIQYTVHNGNYTIPSSITAPNGYSDSDFVGFVKVNGFGTAEVTAEAILAEGATVTAADLEGVYAVWVNVETLTGASASISASSGIKFISTVDSEVLKKVGIAVKSSNSADDGYYRGMVLGTSATDLSLGLDKTNRKMDVKISNAGWNTANYKRYTGAAIPSGKDSFAVTITYNTNKNYHNAVAYRGYIEITIGGESRVIYSDFVAPVELEDSSSAVYGAVHARSARAIVRKLYFSGSLTESALKDKVGESNFKSILAIAGYESFPTDAAITNANYYLNPLIYQAPKEKVINIAVFGDSLAADNNMVDILAEFAAQGGIKLNPMTIKSNNAGQQTNMYYLYELFQNETPAKNNLVANTVIGAGGTSQNANAKTMWMIMNRTANVLEPKSELDYFLIFGDRFYATKDYSSQGNRKTKNEEALYYLKETFADYANTKDTQFIIMAPPTIAEDDYYTTEWYPVRDQAGLNKASSDLAAKIGNSSYFTIGDGWAYFEANYASSGIDLYDHTVSSLGNNLARHPSDAGTYYTACLIYSMLFGNTTTGMEELGNLPKNEAKLLQQAADAYVKSTGKTLTDINTLVPLVKTPIASYDYTDADSDNSSLKYLIASAAAYDARGNWIQYDQRAFNRFVFASGQNRVFRREMSSGFFNAETASPQRIMYQDCSSWLLSMLSETLSGCENWKDSYYGCSDLYNASNKSGGGMTDITVYKWTDDDGDNLYNGNDTNGGDTDNNFTMTVDGKTTTNVSHTAARTAFMNTLQPGDIILTNTRTTLTSSFGADGGHIILYAGNGIVIHCAGPQSATGGDYSGINNSDTREFTGSIQIDPLDIFTEIWSSRYMFDQGSNGAVTIIRPLSKYSANENIKARFDNMLGTVAYRTSTAPDGITVNSGDKVTFTYTVENRTWMGGRKYTVAEVLPAGVTFVSASDGGSYNSSTRTVTFNLILSANETKSVTCTVKVTAASNNTILFENATIGGIKLGNSQIEVDNTLSAKQQAAFSAAAKALLDDGYTDIYALAKAAYSNSGVGITLENNAKTILNAMFEDNDQWNYIDIHPNFSEYSVYYKNWDFKLSGGYEVIFEKFHSGANTSGFFGGQCVRRSTSTQYRVQDVSCENLISGDIILWVDRKDCYDPPASATKAELAAMTDAQKKTAADAITIDSLANAGKIQSCIYLGDNTFIVKDTLGNVITLSGSAANNLAEQFQGEGLWFLYRPSAQ